LPAAVPIVYIPAKAQESELRQLFSQGPLASSKILRLQGNLLDLFGGWTDQVLKESFEVRATGKICCSVEFVSI
jgi:hypothetical protein